MATTVTDNDLDTFYLLWAGALVFFMQAGFALLEAGSVRAKNAKNILLKNLLDACLGAIIWWAWGYGAAYGGTSNTNGFIGVVWGDDAGYFLLKSQNPNGAQAADYGKNLMGWFFQYVFAAAAATIVSGAVAERAALSAYMLYTLVITGFIYPVMVHMTWSEYGALSSFNSNYGATVLGGNVDFAGSGVVHMTGGILALCGAAIIGPRMNRFDASGKPNPMPGHSSVLVVLGTFILWLGWYGFNPGSTLAVVGQGEIMARATVATTIAAAAGGLTTVFLNRILSGIFDVNMACNGILAGLVSITAGCAVTYPWASFCIGVVGSFVYYGSSKLVLKLKIDDVLDAFAVHGACGAWGVLAVGWFGAPEFMSYSWATNPGAPTCVTACYKGLFYGGGMTFAAQLVSLIIEIAWVGGMGVILFAVLKATKLLRVSPEVEQEGLDVSKHGGSAYPEDAGSI